MVVERACRTAIEPLIPLYSIHFAACVCYLIGFVRFQFFDPSTGFTFFTAVHLLLVLVSGALVPVLAGSVFALHFANRRLQRLASE